MRRQTKDRIRESASDRPVGGTRASASDRPGGGIRASATDRPAGGRPGWTLVLASIACS
jgi:hypothetical protein